MNSSTIVITKQRAFYRYCSRCQRFCIQVNDYGYCMNQNCEYYEK
nr:MAG TPA: hypothetical protein [Caudoviricetes sp.]